METNIPQGKLTPQQIAAARQTANVSSAPQSNTFDWNALAGKSTQKTQGAPANDAASISAQNVKDAISGQGEYSGQSVLRRATGATAAVSSGPLNAIIGALPQNVQQKASNISQAAGGAIQSAADAINWLGDKIGSLSLAQKLANAHPGLTDTILKNAEDVAGTLTNTGTIAGNILTAGGVSSALDKGLVTPLTGSEPSITVGGKTLTLNDIHSAKGSEFFKSLPEADQEAVSNFDKVQSAKQMLDNATAAGKDTTDLKQMYDEAKTNATVPEGSTATVNEGKEGLITKAKNALAGESEEEITPEQSSNAAKDAISTKLSKDEQAQAVSQGRARISGSNKEITYEPSTQDEASIKALKPLADEGKIVSPKTPEDHLNNIFNTQEAIDSRAVDIRSALENSDATWNSNELKGNLENVNIPDPVKNEATMARNAESLKNAAIKIADDAGRDPVDLLDMRQNFDQYIKDNYGQNFFDKGRYADPWHQYVYSLRDSMNDMAQYKLPDGKLPDGTSLRDALVEQSNLINAKEAMAQKFSQDFPEGTTITSRFLKAHPTLRRVGWRVGMSIGVGALGLYGLGTLINKAVKSSVASK